MTASASPPPPAALAAMGLAPAAPTLAADVADAVAQYEASGNVAALHRRLAALADAVPATPAGADALVAAARPFEQVPEVAGPLYERVVARRPDDARALVVLGNAYWLHGRGPDVVGDLAARALAADPANRGAWHLWALTEADPRQRMLRWQQVTVRFPDDDLARALFADSAASVAGAEHDDEALVLAVGRVRGAARPRRAPRAARGAREGARHAARVEAVSPEHALHAAPPAADGRRPTAARSPSSAPSASA
jgi:hypothetical protein